MYIASDVWVISPFQYAFQSAGGMNVTMFHAVSMSVPMLRYLSHSSPDECVSDELVVGEESMSDWTEIVENSFVKSIGFCASPSMCVLRGKI